MSSQTAASGTPLKVHLISDSNVDAIGQYLANEKSTLQLSVSSSPFGQVFRALLEPDPAEGRDFAIVWTSPEIILPTFARALEYAPIDEDQLFSEIHEFAECLRKAQN